MSFVNTSDQQNRQSIPQISTFQFSNDAVGQVKDSVNLFTGTANIPLNIASLPGRKDLDLNLGVMYNSHVQNWAQNWNISHPTGILGLGWGMAFDKIVVNKNGAGTNSSDDFFLLNNGASNQLVQDGYIPSPSNILTYQLRNFEFWDIKYDPAQEKWTLIKEDGTVYIYGDKNSNRGTLQYGVKWGNWLGDSALSSGQEQYVTAWNLSEMQNAWGEKITYSYDNVAVKLGSANGLTYTQASYLKTIVDSFGRTITFQYAEKYGALNPSPQNIIEYQAAHTQTGLYNAYQEQYETRYLDQIEVLSEANIPLFSVQFEYDFINIGINSQTAVYPLMWKRVLKSFWQVQPNGSTLPGMEFEYYRLSSDVNPAALKSMIYPQGAKASYTYKQQFLNTSRNLKLDSPLNGATPRVWFGPDYTLITWYSSADKKLRASLYSWCGNWITFELNSDQSNQQYFDNVDFDLNTLGVITRQQFLALYFVEKTSKQLRLFIYQRNPEKYGVFNLANGAPQLLALNTASPVFGVEAGRDFVVAYSKNFSSNPVYAYQLNWKQNRWDTTPNTNPANGYIPVSIPNTTDVSNASNLVIAAKDNYYIAAFYNQATQLLQFQFFHHDGNNQWSKTSLYSTSPVSIYHDPNNPNSFPFSLSLSNAFAVATYITGLNSSEVNYTLRALQWDKNFYLLNSNAPLLTACTSSITNGKSQFEVFNTILGNALIANNTYLNRYTGGIATSNNPLNWKSAKFTTQASDILNFATGQDTVVMSKMLTNSANNQFLQFNPDTGTWGSVQTLSSTGTNPTLTGNFLTAGTDVFYQGGNGSWQKQQQALSFLSAPQTVQNRGNAFIVYQDNTSDNAQTYLAVPRNGILGAPTKLPSAFSTQGQKIYVPEATAGMILAGSDTFVSYPANQDFNVASSLTLFKVVEGKATDYVQVTPVGYMEIENVFNADNNYYQSYEYDRSAQSIITYDALQNLAQFPKVTVVTGSKIPTPSAAPAGISISYFSNGVSAQAEVPYPSSWIYNYNLLLNGNLLQKTSYNKAGQLVSKETNYWKIFKFNATQSQSSFLYGAYCRLEKNVSMKDGVTQVTDLLYYQDIGLLNSSTTSYCDSTGSTKVVSTQKKYAIQVESYKSAMSQKHYLNAEVQETSSVTNEEGVKTYVASSVVTWKNWAEDGSWKWAAFQNYQWLGPAIGDPSFDFEPDSPRTSWLKKQEIISRALPYNVITEMQDVDGISSSYLYDKTGHFQVAEFPTASAQGDEVAFFSFEPYEQAGSWQIGTNAAIIPNLNDPSVDAQIGRSSLKIGNGLGIQRQFTPVDQSLDFVFSAYVKLPNGFDNSQGMANWVISFFQGNTPVGTPITVPFGSILGSWQYLYQIISLKTLNPNATNSLITIQVAAQNNNTTSTVLVDCLRFSPLDSLFAAVSVDPGYDIAACTLGANGESKRKFFDDFQRVVATTSFSGETMSMASNYFSRTGNDNRFSSSDPNNKLKVLCAGGGPALPFTKGDEWQEYWTPGEGSVWTQEGGILKLDSFQSVGSLSFRGARNNQYGLLTRINALSGLDHALGIKIGNMFTLQWLPSAGQWQLLNANGTVLQEKTIFKFELENSTNLSSADLASRMRPFLLRRGLNISKNSNLLQATKNGIYDGHYHQFYSLKESGTVTQVSTMGNQWMLLVNTKSLFFFVDGQLVFNYVNETAIDGVPTLFAGNNVTLDYLLSSFDNQCTLTFANETGNDKQSQLLDDTRLTVIENFYDPQGRIIVNTKPAYVTADQASLFQYCANFASYNLLDGTISGLLNDYYPADAGYPYFGTAYEASPLGRVVESSMPGADYKMGTHTEKIFYGTNDGSFGLPAGKYYQTTVVDQNGNTTYSIADTRGLEVRKINLKSTNEAVVATVIYDDAGNPVFLRSPNYQSELLDKSNWETENTYNFIGQFIQTQSATGGITKMIYDYANRLRFRQDAQAALDGNYQYYKYDRAGRIFETGYLTGNWDEDQLQTAAYDAAYPSTPPTWRRKLSYDYNGSTQPFQIGQVIQTMNNHSDQNLTDVIENFEYDIFGNVKTRSQQILSFSTDFYTTRFYYNNLGGIIQIDYPALKLGSAFSVYYTYNVIGQIVGIGNQATQPNNLATYTYNPAGKPLQEVLNPLSTQAIVRNYAYNSPVWLEQISDRNSAGTTLMNELLLTASTQPDGPTYYNGQAAELAYEYPAGIDAGATYTNWYNSLNALERVVQTGPGTTNAGLEKQYQFDDNGNFNTVSIAGNDYTYLPATNQGNRLQSVQNAAGNSLFSFQYGANGAVSHYSALADESAPNQQLQFAYDPGTRMTTQVENQLSARTYKFLYSSSNDRLLKQESANDQVMAETLYIKSLAGNTLAEIYRQTDTEQCTYLVYGPTGITTFVKDNVQYNPLKDHLGSVRVILDANAAVVAAYDYDLYGNVRVLQEPSTGFFNYLYTSQEFDLELGIYNYKARFYFSRVGRFGTMDNYNQFYSPYIYAGNNPLLYIDPSGNFSIGNFFSAIAGAIVGAFEILIGIAVDAIAGILEVITGGLSTPVSVGLAMVAGAFIGSGVSAVSYSAVSLVTNEFSWKEYGINTAVGFVAGAITAGFGAVGAAAAEAATGVKAAAEAGQAVSTLAKVANAGIKGAFTVTGGVAAAETSSVINNAASGQSLTHGLGETLVTSVLSSALGWAIPDIDYKAGWGNLFKRMAASVAKSEAIGVSVNLGTNAVNGDPMSTGLLNTVVNGVVGGSIGGLGTKDFAQAKTKQELNFMNISSTPQQQVPADGIIRLG